MDDPAETFDPDEEADNFQISGPTVPPVDWTSPDYRRIVVASLVKGVYVLENEHDRFRKRALAPEWWESFDFKLMRELFQDNFLTSVIFEYRNSNNHSHSHNHSHNHHQYCQDSQSSSVEHAPPRFVVAFRGTRVFKNSFIKDCKNNILSYVHILDKSVDCKMAMEAVKDLVSINGNSSSGIWLAGHSLGSSFAMVVGRKLIQERDTFLECFLFDPPFVESVSKMIPNGKIKRMAEQVSRFKKAVKEKFAKEDQGSSTSVQEDARLFRWTPHLFVNPNDSIAKYQEEDTMDC